MEARRLRLERLNSMPNMKVNTDLYNLANDTTCPTKHILLPFDTIDEHQNTNEMTSSDYSYPFENHTLEHDNSALNLNYKDTILELQELRPLLRISDHVTAANY